jgi:hypothetical protein
MDGQSYEASALAGTGALMRATVILVHGDGSVLVSCDAEPRGELVCDLLETSGGRRMRLGARDKVLVCLPAGGSERGVILGRTSRGGAKTGKPAGMPDDIPEEIVLEASKGLTLRVGDGSITLRADGRILIKGKDLVSHAQRMNRIKGGAVSIN